MKTNLRKRFQGSLIGLAVGDALGGKFEGQDASYIQSRLPNLDALIHYPAESLWYTDDTQMMIGVAETLLTNGSIQEERLCKAFVENYVPSRGYGRGARAIIEAMEEGRDYQLVAKTIFTGGSYGNGGAMRVAPVGLRFHLTPDRLIEQAILSALPTHTHPLGIEGTTLMAIAVGLALTQADDLNQAEFVSTLLKEAKQSEFKERLEKLAKIRFASEIPQLGNGIAAHESVVTAIACFLVNRDSFSQTIAEAIFLGGDTDTIAAMAGALSGAYLGIDEIPSHLIDKLEDTPKGKAYLFDLANQLFEQLRSNSSI